MEKQYLIIEWRKSSDTVSGTVLVAHGPFRDPDYAMDWANDELVWVPNNPGAEYRLCEYTPNPAIQPTN